MRERFDGARFMERDAELSSGVVTASRTGRNRVKLPQKPRRGYHRAVTPELAAEICRRLASGRTLRAVCRDRDMPHHDAVYDEMNRSPAFAEAIARARTESAHGLAMEALDIADSAGPEDNPQLIKNRCDLRRWLAGKYNALYSGPNSDAFARTRARTFRGVSGYARNLEQTRPSFQNEAPG
jgi:hypothetical protein